MSGKTDSGTESLLLMLHRAAETQGALECESLARLLRALGDRNSFVKLLAKQQVTLFRTASTASRPC